jgi:Ca2+-binding RTX toxin-like protein
VAAAAFFGELGIALHASDKLLELGPLVWKDLTGQFHSEKERFDAYAAALNAAFNPLANTTAAVAKLGGALAHDAFEAIFKAAVSPLIDLAKMLPVGTDQNDAAQGTGKPDFFFLKAGDDKAFGMGGDDTFVGGSGNGDDLYDGGTGIDEVLYESASKGVKVDLGKGKAKGPQVGADKLVSIDYVHSGAGKDSLTGSAGDNMIDGGAGNDRIRGLGGKDVLTGGDGRDEFVFAAKLDAATNIDEITDFSPKDDLIVLAKSVFKGLHAGHLSKKAFFKGDGAHDANDRIGYDPATGALVYDANGSHEGGAVQFASLAPGLNLSSGNFFVI